MAKEIDYDALAKKFGAIEQPMQPEVDYDALAAQFGAEQAQPAQPKTSMWQNVGQGVGNIAAGAVRGAGSIGATLIRPFESAQENEARRQAIDEGLRSMGAEPESWMYQGGKIAGEIAGTAGAGGVLAKGIQFAPRLASGYIPSGLAPALQSGGFSSGAGIGTNIGAGALAGGAAAGLTGGDITTGAGIGAALPAAVRGIPTMAKAVAGTTSGIGSTPLEEAFKAGKGGGATGQAFRENIKGDAPINDALVTAKNALNLMRQDRANRYKATIGKSFDDTTPLDFTPIENTLNKTLSSVKGRGSSVLQEVSPETTIWVDKFGQRAEVPETFKPPKIDNFLTEVRRAGGINSSYASEFGLTPAEAAKTQLFRKDGKGLDELSRSIEQKGWIGEHTLADADYGATGGREGYLKDMIKSAMSDSNSIIHPRQQDDWFNYLNAENALVEQGINKVTIPAKTKQTSGEYWTIGKDEQGKISEVADIIQEWKLDPARHNVEGLDALKRRIGAVYPENPKQAQAQRVIDTMYNSVKKTIEEQAPDYAATMKDYSTMTDQIREIEKSLSLGNKATADTAMRKLQSLMRNNVATNYGGRIESAGKLSEYGAENLMPALAGQALSELAPRGIARAGNIAGFGAAITANPLSALALPLASPRLMGEAAYGAGRLSGLTSKIPYNEQLLRAARQAGITQGSQY